MPASLMGQLLEVSEPDQASGLTRCQEEDGPKCAHTRFWDPVTPPGSAQSISTASVREPIRVPQRRKERALRGQTLP